MPMERSDKKALHHMEEWVHKTSTNTLELVDWLLAQLIRVDQLAVFDLQEAIADELIERGSPVYKEVPVRQ